MKQKILEIEQQITNALEGTPSMLKFLDPQNIEEEKIKFFQAQEKNEEYNPYFMYLPRNPVYSYFMFSSEYANLMKKLTSINTNEIKGSIVEERKKYLIKRIHLVGAVGRKDFSEKAIDYYGEPEKKTINLAKEYIELESKQEKNTLSSKDLCEELKLSLKNIKEYKCIIAKENITAKIVINHGLKELQIKENFYFSKQDAKRLAMHEIETHIYRKLNGLEQEAKLFSQTIGGEVLKTEEGLAAVNEEIFGYISNDELKKYAGRVLAVEEAKNKSFQETYDFLKNYFTKEESWQMTLRVKRGLAKTEQPGANTKDHLYLQGMQDIKNYLRKGNDIKELYYGKLACSEVEKVKTIFELKKPKYLPKYEKKKIEAIL